jgi:pilus assembly protein CpaF
LRVHGEALRTPVPAVAALGAGLPVRTGAAQAAGAPAGLVAGALQGGGAAAADDAPAPVACGSEPERLREAQLAALPWRRLVHRRLLDLIDLRRSNLAHYSAEQLLVEVRQAVEGIVADLGGLPQEIDRPSLVEETVNEAIGLGPLERLMAQPDVTEIMVNSAVDVFVERSGRLERATAAFSDDTAIRNVIDRIVSPLGRRIDEASPLVDARLADGSRVNAIIPPVALKGPALTIRRFNRTVLSPQDLVTLGSASRAMIDFFRICVEERKSIVVSGGTGSGKTTLLNVLSNLIPPSERLITIEDAAELKLRHDHLVALEARPPNAEGRGAVTIRDLVRNSLRMRPDRIIVGECRGGEALDMLQAMNTGHEGSLTTVHANTPRDVLSRLEVLTLMGGVDLPIAAIREQIASALDLIVHQARFRDGSRRITSVTEVTGIESGRVQTQELFRYHQAGNAPEGMSGLHVACGAIPTFREALVERGVAMDLMLFREAR